MPPLALYVWGLDEAKRRQRRTAPDALTVLAAMTMSAERFSAILVETPPRHLLESAAFADAYAAWCDWLPTRLAPGCDGRVIHL